jgi:hypothetical protein
MKFCTEKTGKRLKALGIQPMDKTWKWSLDEVLDRLPATLISKIPFLTLPMEFTNAAPIFPECDLEFYKLKDTYVITYHPRIGGELSENEADYFIRHENPAEAAAQLLIWCVENGYVTTEKRSNEDN